VKPASTWQTNYQNSGSRAQTDWLAGIQGTNKDWQGLTVAAIPRMVSGFNAAAGSGRIAAGVQRVSTAQWKQRSEAKQGAYGAGITAGAGAYGVAAGKLFNFLSSAVPALPARGDINANLQRGNTLALALHQNKGNFSGKA
jgi:hypothetical protein